MKNKYDLSGEYGIGYTSKGEPFYFDKEDYDLIKNYNWYLTSEGYVAAMKNRKTILFHRVVMKCSAENEVDHIYHVLNDNRKIMLRICDDQQNALNRSLRTDNTSGKTGVSLNKRNGKWRAYITIDNKQKSLGHFSTFEEAVEIRVKAEKEIFKNFRYTERSDSLAELS